MLKDIIYDEFQHTVSEILLCNRSILDLLAKSQETNARMNRAIIKSVTGCGCIRINAAKKKIPPETSLEGLKKLLESHLEGELCDNCREIVELEMGRNLFYLAALCNLLDLNMYDVLIKEQKKLKALGLYNLA
ncbi:DUF1573 domain-containing protein [Desulfallas thermosapovorans]|uniref:DUF1573 domain-containing protein n=1 Tax=Desulfallas thermosapovorans DSM 6562 TaxID=1121431 RepID=A0A5S4ZRD2_9FIRM|nr:DUF1573 domain-containing protein [Desulfallas thermosapovorans]TYO94647.1 hypothetical protein LX24_02308 [Desulfallas thermosapovorans DSM 6562]